MKVLLTLIFTIFMVGACQTETKEEPTTDPKTVESPATEQTTEAIAFESLKDALKGFVDGSKAKDEKQVRAALSEADNKALDTMLKTLGKKDATLFDVKQAFSKEIPMAELKDEKIDGDKATVQARESKDGKWEAINFVKENGSWKLSLGFDKLEAMTPKGDSADKPEETETAKPKPEVKDDKKETKKEGEIPSDESFSDGK